MRISDWSSDVCSSDLFSGLRRRCRCRERLGAIGLYHRRGGGTERRADRAEPEDAGRRRRGDLRNFQGRGGGTAPLAESGRRDGGRLRAALRLCRSIGGGPGRERECKKVEVAGVAVE